VIRTRSRGLRRRCSRLCVDRLAGRAAAALGAYQLLDHLEERHDPAEVDAAVERFVEALRSRLGG
jgi:hypothetical protein